MFMFKVLPHWFGIMVVGVVLTTVTGSAVFANSTATPESAEPSCPPKQTARSAERPSTPPGQLVRRGITGNVVSVSSGTPTRIIVETQFGNVEIEPPAGFDISSVKVGDRIAVLLEKEPAPVRASPTPAQTDTPFRVGKALRMKVIPADPTLTHQRGVVTNQQGDTLELADEDGNVKTLKVTGKGRVQVTKEKEGKAQREVQEEQVSQGTDAVLLVQCAGKEPKPEVKGVQNAQRVTDRLEQLKAQAEQRSNAQAAKIADLQQKNAERQQQRLERTASRVPASVRETVERARGKAQERPCPGVGTAKGQDCPKAQETPQDKGKSQDKGRGNK